MPVYKCEYCGKEFSNPRDLGYSFCRNHPNGPNKGYHKMYEGGYKPFYTCKYCGKQSSDMKDLVFGSCPRHPNGPYKGKHCPSR